MKYEKKADRVYIARARIEYAARYTGALKSLSAVFRIDGREGAYRCDRLGTLGYIFEAIDGGEGLQTLAAAKAYIRAYVRAIKDRGEAYPALASA